jgi:hypothetical protein
MTPDWIFIITMAGIFFGLLISLHLVTIKRPGLGTKWLGRYTMLLTASLAEPLAEGSVWAILLGGISLLFGPFLYFYLICRIRSLSSLPPRHFWHAAPFVLYNLLILLSFFSSDKPANAGQENEWIDLLLYELLFIQIFSYCIAGLRFITRNKGLLIIEDQDVGRMKIAFLRILVGLSIMLFLGSWLATHFFIIGGMQPGHAFKSGVQIGLCLLIFIIALLNTETMHARKLIKAF